MTEIAARTDYAGPEKPLLQEVVDNSTLSQYEIKDLKEIQCAILNNNSNGQYTSYNYPFLVKTNHRHQA